MMFARSVAAVAVLVALLLAPSTTAAAAQQFMHGLAALAVEVPRARRRRASQAGERLYHSPDEFARRASISRATVWRLMRAGKLRYARFGRARRIPVSEYERLASEAQ
jgi:excisionase family DNA binding protein